MVDRSLRKGKEDEAKEKKKEFLKEGYSDADAHKLSVLSVDLETITRRNIGLNRSIQYLETKEKKSRKEQDDEKSLVQEYEENLGKLKEMREEIKSIERRKKLLGKSRFEIENEKIEELAQKDFLRKRGKLSEEDYKKDVEKITGRYKEIFTSKKEKEDKRKEKELYASGTFAGAVKKNRESDEAIKKLKQDIIDQYGFLDPDAFERGKKRIDAEIFGDAKKYEKIIARCSTSILDIEEKLKDTTISQQERQRLEAKKQKFENVRTEARTKKEGAYQKGGERTYKESVAGGPTQKFFEKSGGLIKKGLFLAALIGIGAVISASFGQMLFFFAFLSTGLYFLTPSPSEFDHAPINTEYFWKLGSHLNDMRKYKAHSSYAILKSLFKVSTIICFAFAFKNMGDIFNSFFMITCLAGYFALKVTYKNSGEFLESFLRFAILGVYFIPFNVFAGIFNSYVLAFIAMAFFAIPPMPDVGEMKSLPQAVQEAGSGRMAYYEMIDKFIFMGFMIFALIGSGALGTNTGVFSFFNVGWQLSGTLAATFIYFWLVSAIGGFFSPPQERPITGALFLGAATIIYAVGPGSQDIGSALLGQWWPSINQGVTAISEPIGKMFGQLGKTFGDAFLLLTNPVGYATQLMNGSYANNPVGETGAYGVELSGFEVSPVFIGQPFMITANVKNNGAYNAEGLSIALKVGGKAPEKQTSVGTPSLSTPISSKNPLSWPTKPLVISQIGIKDNTCDRSENKDESICIHKYKSESDKDIFTRQNIWQTVFSSQDGIKCEYVYPYELRKKSIPINITLEYTYQSDSKVEVEFISKSEWDRLAKLDQLNQKLRFVKSEYSTAPVKFPIGTPGLKNPILETQDFHVALNIMSDQQGGKIDSIESIVLNYPADFELTDDKCSPAGTEGTVQNGGKTIAWTNKKSGDQIFYCHFKALKSDKGSSGLGTSPTKTYILTAHAKYRYSNSKEKLVKVEFGSWCCTQETAILSKSNDACASGMQCCPEDKVSGKGICAPLTQNCEGG